MWKVAEIALCVVLPLAWGLAVELLFELFRRRRAAGGEGRAGEGEAP